MPDPELLPNLPPSVARQTIQAVTSLLPPPPIDTPQERAAREGSAIATLAALRPADAFEALLAAEIVGAHAHALDCLRLAALPHQQPEEIRRCRAQAAAMMRAMQSARRALHSMQAARRKADSATRQQALPPEEPRPLANIAAEADQYALRHRKRATLIRSLGRLPDRLDYGPLPPELVRTIVTGTSPVLRALDRHSRPAIAVTA